MTFLFWLALYMVLVTAAVNFVCWVFKLLFKPLWRFFDDI